MNNPLRHQVRSPVASYVQPPHRVQHPSEMYCTLVCRVQDVVYTILAIYTCVVYTLVYRVQDVVYTILAIYTCVVYIAI
jgi:hypothetical protein